MCGGVFNIYFGEHVGIIRVLPGNNNVSGYSDYCQFAYNGFIIWLKKIETE